MHIFKSFQAYLQASTVLTGILPITDGGGGVFRAPLISPKLHILDRGRGVFRCMPIVKRVHGKVEKVSIH